MAARSICRSVDNFEEGSLAHERFEEAGVLHWFEEVNKRPTSIEEVEGRGYYIDAFGDVSYTDEEIISDPNHVSSKDRAEGLLALGQLLELRDAWNEGWTAKDATEDEDFFSISECPPLHFRDEETAKEFLEQFRDLIETARPVLS